MECLNSTRNTRPILPNSLRFLRSDVPYQLTEEERQWLIANRITTLIDLREASERRKKPCALADDDAFQYHMMPVTGGNAVPSAPDAVAASYIRMADDVMTQIIDTILRAKTNVMYFCNAGKDRTGVVSAILLSRLGYSKEYIIEDYLRSKENLAAELEAFAAQNPNVDLEVITPNASYMEDFLAWYQQHDSAFCTLH